MLFNNLRVLWRGSALGNENSRLCLQWLESGLQGYFRSSPMIIKFNGVWSIRDIATRFLL